MSNWETAQSALVEHLRRNGATERVLAALSRVPRDMFVDQELRHRAFEDEALPIGRGQTISQPAVVAAMTEALALEPHHRVLEVGTGSGYQAAVLAELARDVITVERDPALAARAWQCLEYMGYRNVTVQTADGTLGWPPAAPYDAILVAAAGPTIPQPLIEQLAPGGRLVLPVGGRDEQQLILVTRQPNGPLREVSLGPVRFVPLVGQQGWPERES
ncbi:MAG TPA: protein-L-isoaspartate(D-aspartate) O-methyltransferase [Chloroflexota bacterium]|nr:protein-L-isoaspartate(D-aspartate) O-methyltransferase [Chloroflexota bacterium]